MTRNLAKRHAIGSRLKIQFRGGEIFDGLRGVPAHRLPGIQNSFRSDHLPHCTRANATSWRTMSHLFQQSYNQSGPSGLMIGPATATVIAVKIFEKPHEVAPVRIFRKDAHVPLPGAAARGVREK